VLIQPKVVPLSHAEEHASIAEPVFFPLEREAATPAPLAAKPREDDEIAAFIGRLMFEEPETESAQATPRRSPLIALIAAELLLVALAGGGWYWWHNRVRVTAPNLFPQSANLTTSTSVLPPANTRTAPLVSSPVPEALKTVEASGPSSAPAENPAESHEAPNAASKKPAAISHSRVSRPNAKRRASLAKVPEAPEGIDAAPENSSRVSAEGLSALIARSGLQPAAPKPERPIGGEVKAARLISSVPPAYPPLARSQGVEGDITLDALIDETGRVTKIKTISGPELLQQAAAAAVRQWKYEPAALDGKAVPMHLTVTVKFRTR
jgi:protein TonB